MNGTYKPLIEYIDKDMINKISNYETTHSDEFKFRVKNFYDKYDDVFINNMISQIKNCDITKIYSTEIWTLQYKILGSDIKIIDPNNPDNALEVVKIFFKKCCKILDLELTGFELVSQEGDNLIFTISFKNPLRDRFVKNIEEIMN